MSEAFTLSAHQRLQNFLQKNDQPENIEQLTPDASTREFFRLEWKEDSAVACIYPEKFGEDLPQIDVTNLFLAAKLSVAEIFEVDYENGIVLHEDFGNAILRDVLGFADSSTKEDLLNSAISMIAKIQHSTPIAFERNSISSKLKFDEEKLAWELDFFKLHYFSSLKNSPLPPQLGEAITGEFIELSKELEQYATVLTHRDFHAANLMVDDEGNLRIIDHQDARLGSVAYDLVSLLLDRITELPSQEWLTSKKNYLLAEREKLGLDKLEHEKFDHEFELMTVQRCLKAIGTFSNQAGNLGKDHFVEYIDPMFAVVLDACKRLQKFPNLQAIIKNIIAK